jgi:hypothetical protein
VIRIVEPFKASARHHPLYFMAELERSDRTVHSQPKQSQAARLVGSGHDAEITVLGDERRRVCVSQREVRRVSRH